MTDKTTQDISVSIPQEVFEQQEDGYVLPIPRASKDSIEIRMETYSGPVPHPSTVKAWNDSIPGSGKQIVDMALKSLDVELKLKLRYQTFKFIDRILAFVTRFFGQTIAAACLGVILYVAVLAIEAKMEGLAITAIAAVGGVVTVAITGQRKAEKKGERQDE